MAILSLSGISKSYGVQLVLKDASFHIEAGQKVGVVGPNGAGKSTLFKIICGQLAPDTGTVTAPRDVTVGYMPQTADFDSEKNLYDEMLSVFSHLMQMETEMRRLEKDIARAASGGDAAYMQRLMQTYSALTDEFNRMEGYACESRTRGMITGLGFSAGDFDKPVSHLSGGQKTRVALGKLLLKKPGILLLDEPTNYLDLNAVSWLEGFLKEYPGTVLVISHDRYFLDAVTGFTLEVSGGTVKGYKGGYTAYRQAKKAEQDQQDKIFDLRAKQIARLEAQVARFKSMRNFNQAESRLKALERIALPARSEARPRAARFGFEQEIESGNDVLAVEDLSKCFDGNRVFERVSFEIKKGERVCLIGRNGVGKTTLFKIIAGLLNPDGGEVFTGRNVEIGYYQQEQEGLHDSGTVIDEVWDVDPELTRTQVRSLLARFGFKGDEVFKSVSDLSGGEKSRVALAKLLLSRANFLLLDEPTNHLDMDIKETLEDALLDYPGTVFAISHDRYFLNRVATRILELTPEGVVNYSGNYDYYLYKSSENRHTGETLKQKKERPAPDSRDIKARQEAKEREKAVARLEDEITAAELRLEELEKALGDPETYSDAGKAREVNLEYAHLKADLEKMYDEWEKLNLR